MGWGGTSTALLEILDVEGRNCPSQRVSDVTCEFIDDGIRIVVIRQHEPNDPIKSLMSVLFHGTSRRTGTTPDAGQVKSSSLDCFFGASTVSAPDPCELELQGIERGVPEQRSAASGGSGSDAIVEVGSRVRVRVSCPSGLYYSGTDDVNAFAVPITPSEFALEARDCVLGPSSDEDGWETSRW